MPDDEPASRPSFRNSSRAVANDSASFGDITHHFAATVRDITFAHEGVTDEVVAGVTRLLTERHGGHEDFTVTTQAAMLEAREEPRYDRFRFGAYR